MELIVQVQHEGELRSFAIPATLQVKPPDRDDGTSKRIKTLVDKWRSNQEFVGQRMAEFWIPHWIRTGANGIAGHINYDGISVLMNLWERTQDPKILEAAVTLHERWVYPASIRSSEWEVAGYFNFNRGLVDLARCPDVSSEVSDHARHTAFAYATESAFSRTGILRNPNWPFTAQRSREIALGMYSKIQVHRLGDIMGPDERRYIEAAYAALIEVYIPQWIRVCKANDPDEMKTLKNNVAPFIMAINARSAIAAEKFLNRQDAYSALSELADAIYPLLWRKNKQGEGFIYRPGEEVPAPDLAGLIFMWFAWLARGPGSKRNEYATIAEKLFELSVDHAAITFMKQGNQAFLMSGKGIEWMGWD